MMHGQKNINPAPCSRTAYMACMFYLIRTIENHYSLHNMQRLTVFSVRYELSLFSNVR